MAVCNSEHNVRLGYTLAFPRSAAAIKNDQLPLLTGGIENRPVPMIWDSLVCQKWISNIKDTKSFTDIWQPGKLDYVIAHQPLKEF